MRSEWSSTPEAGWGGACAGRLRRRRTGRRAGTALIAFVLLAGACAPSTSPTLDAAPDSRDAARAMELAIVAGDAPDDLGAIGPPELLDLASATLDTSPLEAGRALAEDDMLALELPDLQAFVDETEVVEAGAVPSGEGGADPQALDPAIVATEAVDGVPEVEPVLVLPKAPPAAPGPPARYDDPSEAVVFASGRPLELFPAGETTTRGVTETTIRIGGVVTQTVAGLPHRADACTGARARVGQANAYGELDQRIVFVDCLDDAGQSEFADGMARSLVDRSVFAIAPVASTAFLGDLVLNEERVPYTGSDALPGYCSRASLFGYGVSGAADCPVLAARGYLSLVEPVVTAWLATRPDLDPGARVVLATETSAAGAAVGVERAFEAELAGLTDFSALEVLPPATASRPGLWRTYARRILDLEPEVVLLEGHDVTGLPAALRDLGFLGEVVVVGRLDPARVADDEWRAGMAPATIVSTGIDLASRDARGWRAIEGAAAAVGVAPDDISLDFVEGYAAVDFLVQAIGDLDGPVSAESLHTMINSGWWYPGIDGVLCGSWWPASHFIEAPCASVAGLNPDEPRLIPVLSLVESAPQLRFDLDD